MVHNPPAWRFVVFNIGGDDALLLGLAPNPVMPPRMGQVIAIRLGPAERSAIDEQLAVDQPEDADAGLFVSTGGWSGSLGCHEIPSILAIRWWVVLKSRTVSASSFSFVRP